MSKRKLKRNWKGKILGNEEPIRRGNICSNYPPCHLHSTWSPTDYTSLILSPFNPAVAAMRILAPDLRFNERSLSAPPTSANLVHLASCLRENGSLKGCAFFSLVSMSDVLVLNLACKNQLSLPITCQFVTGRPCEAATRRSLPMILDRKMWVGLGGYEELREEDSDPTTRRLVLIGWTLGGSTRWAGPVTDCKAGTRRGWSLLSHVQHGRDNERHRLSFLVGKQDVCKRNMRFIHCKCRPLQLYKDRVSNWE